MGHTIAQIAATAGFEVTVRDIAQECVDNAKSRVERNPMRNVERGRMTEEEAQEALRRLSYSVDLADSVKDADLVIEAIPENLDLKRSVWGRSQASLGGMRCLRPTHPASVSPASQRRSPSRRGSLGCTSSILPPICASWS